MGSMYLTKSIIKGFIKFLAPGLLIKIRKRNAKNVLYKSYKHIRNEFKIIYALTPPERLSNIGDHAQVVAIYKWLNHNYPSTPIIEVDKDKCISMINILKRLVTPKDLIFIHSGGNLGDRGIWSETGRRNLIANFPKNKIVSLPQTIFFSNTKEGRKEREISKHIYNLHTNLTIIARDLESGRLAKEIFPNCRTFSIPDFVLYLKSKEILKIRNTNPQGTLLCLRNDNESILTDKDRILIQNQIKQPVEFFDTTIDKPIYRFEREEILKKTIEYFDQFELIITDRFHGLIFAVLIQKPTIVLPTIDHKLTSAINWFREINNIRYVALSNLSEINKIQDEVLQNTHNPIDWQSLYFDNLKMML